MPRKKTRAKKGSVSVTARRGMLLLRWRYEGKRRSLSYGKPDSLQWRLKAKELATRIEQDMAYGNYDETLDRYRQQPRQEEDIHPLSTAELFEQFIESRRQQGSGEYNLHEVYGTMLRYLQRFGNIDSVDRALEFVGKVKVGGLRARAAKPIRNRTLNKYLSMLRRFARWAIANDYWDTDHFRRCETVRTAKNRAGREAFSDEERDRILSSLRFSRYYRHYHGFVSALFFLGFRPSELIGLQWKHVDIEGGNIIIAESLSRGPDGKSASYARQRNNTKGKITKEVRILPLGIDQVQILSRQREQCSNPKPDDLVFPSPRGMAIDDHNFCNRPWKKILTAAQIEPYRPPYAARHTFATWAKRNGMTDEQLAYWMGHKTIRMVTENYGHLDKKPIVPQFTWIPLEDELHLNCADTQSNTQRRSNGV
jgi:integrase